MKFDSIQCLRALAVLMVIIFHSHWAAIGKPGDFYQIPLISDYGYLGVYLFFCISGFIMAHLSTKPNFSRKEFFTRRIIRIIPLYWIVLISILIVSGITNVFDGQVKLLGFTGIVKSFLIIPMESYPLYSPGWSLEHELIFYCLVAVIVPFSNINILATILFMLSFIGLSYKEWDYHLFSIFNIYFATGIIAYSIKNKPFAILGGISIFLLILGYSSFYGLFNLSALERHIVFSFGFCFLIASTFSLELNGFSFPKIFIRIGDCSYALYMTHVFVYISFEKISWIYKVEVNPETWRAFGILCAICFSYFVHTLIEKPTHKKIRKLSSSYN